MGESVVLFEINGILKLAMVSKIVQAQRVQFGNLEKATQIAQLAHLSQVNSVPIVEWPWAIVQSTFFSKPRRLFQK